jgi:pimeloyl-ACP methyl ester carboxylesterase
MTNAYTRIGNGPEAVMVLHGWFGDHKIFSPMFDALDTSRFSYVFCDYRGYGKNIGVTGSYSLKEIAADAIAIADSLGFERFHVIGHSMGGAAAQRLCVDAGSRVSSCVCLTPVPASGVPMDADQLALFSGAVDDDGNRAGIIHYSTGNRLPQAWVDHLVAASRNSSTKEAYAAYFRSWSGADFANESQGMQTPFLILVGEHDLALTEDFMRATYGAYYPNCEIGVIPASGHYPMVETPLALVSRLEAFLGAPRVAASGSA